MENVTSIKSKDIETVENNLKTKKGDEGMQLEIGEYKTFKV